MTGTWLTTPAACLASWAVPGFLWGARELASAGTVSVGTLQTRVETVVASRATKQINHRRVSNILEAAVTPEAPAMPNSTTRFRRSHPRL